jgi:transcriptional regulator with XRE-family HTH domain
MVAGPFYNTVRGGSVSSRNLGVLHREAILAARKSQKLSQRQLADLCGCSQNAIHLIESGKADIVRAALAATLCSVLGLRREDVFGDPTVIVVPFGDNGPGTTGDNERMPA